MNEVICASNIRRKREEDKRCKGRKTGCEIERRKGKRKKEMNEEKNTIRRRKQDLMKRKET